MSLCLGKIPSMMLTDQVFEVLHETSLRWLTHPLDIPQRKMPVTNEDFAWDSLFKNWYVIIQVVTIASWVGRSNASYRSTSHPHPAWQEEGLENNLCCFTNTRCDLNCEAQEVEVPGHSQWWNVSRVRKPTELKYWKTWLLHWPYKHTWAFLSGEFKSHMPEKEFLSQDKQAFSDHPESARLQFGSFDSWDPLMKGTGYLASQGHPKNPKPPIQTTHLPLVDITISKNHGCKITSLKNLV